MEHLSIASLGKAYGLKGEFHAFSMTSFPKERFRKGKKYVLTNQKTGEEKEVTLKTVRITGDVLVLGFEEITNVDETAAYRDWTVDMDKADAPLPKDTYRFADLIGCTAIDDDGNELGTVCQVTDYAPTKNLKIEREDAKPFYVPFNNSFVGEIDIENKKIVIHVCEGML